MEWGGPRSVRDGWEVWGEERVVGKAGWRDEEGYGREGKRWEEEGAKGEEGIIEEVAREVAVRGGNNTERRSGMGKGKTKQMRRWKVYGEGVVGRGWGKKEGVGGGETRRI